MPTETDSVQPERYVYDDKQTIAQAFAARRTADRWAGFFLPHLNPGMRLLDCGCGLGSITAGLAEAVSPGETVGVDVDANLVRSARAWAVDEGIATLRFEVGNAYDLPFPDHSFDAVYSNALLEHLGDPLAALKELRRVLKQDGVAGIQAPDFAGVLNAPVDLLVEQLFVLAMPRRIQHHGGDPYVGRRLHQLMWDAGFARVEMSATYYVDKTPDEVAVLLVSTGITDELVELGWVGQTEVAEMITAWERWASTQGVFHALPLCQVVGWNE